MHVSDVTAVRVMKCCVTALLAVRYCGGELSPVSAVVGGVLGQEIIKVNILLQSLVVTQRYCFWNSLTPFPFYQTCSQTLIRHSIFVFSDISYVLLILGSV